MRFVGVWLCLLGFPAMAQEAMTYTIGTGFVIDGYGHVLTSRHVVSACGRLTVASGSAVGEAQRIADDPQNDIALLKVDMALPPPLAFRNGRQPLREGDPLVVVGYPGSSWERSAPVVRETALLDSGGALGNDSYKWLMFGDVLSGGNSGGPLLDASGNVVGMVAAKTRETLPDKRGVRKASIALALPFIFRFLDAQQVQYQQRDSGIYMPAGNVADQARKAIVNVRCRVQGSP